MNDGKIGTPPLTADEKRILLARLLRERAPTQQSAVELEEPAEPALVPTGREGDLPLSFSQERMWFLHQLEPENVAYNIPSGMRVTGSIDEAVLERSIREVARRHSILRSTFPTVNGKPVQRVRQEVDFDLEIHDLRPLSGSELDQEIQWLAAQNASRPFDLASGPLFRALLARTPGNASIIFMTMHHIVSDAWSIVIMMLEVISIYEAFARGSASPLPDLPIQYSDFAAWQREWLLGKRLEDQLTYWRERLKGTSGILDLPADHPRPATPSKRGARYHFEIPSELTRGLKELSKRENVSLFMTLLASFQVLLYRYTGQEDIIVGCSVTNRTRPQVLPLIGPVMNTLPLRGDLSGDPPFREFLARIRGVTLGAYTHQDLPFERLVDDLQLVRSLNRTPLFQTMMAFPQGPVRSLELAGREIEPVEIFSGAAKFDLLLTVVEKYGELMVFLDYRSDLFEHATIAGMAGHFRNLLAGAVAAPETRISQMPLMPDKERQVVLAGFNNTTIPFREDTNVVELFEEQVARNPVAPAILYRGRDLTYQELDRQAAGLARRLRGMGFGADSLAGVFLERCPEMAVGVLAVLKAGGAFVPIDPAYPKDRIAFILEDSQAKVLLTQTQFLSLLPGGKPETILLDEGMNFAGAEAQGMVALESPRPEHLAYVMYTSGSTGKPKGAMIEHRGFTNYLQWVTTCLMTDRVRYLPMVTKLSFDASLKQLFGPLLRGDPVWIIPQETVAQPDALIEALTTRSGVALNCVPSLWRAILDVFESGRRAPEPGSLTTLMVGGDVLSPELAERSFRVLPDLEIINIYGPAEASANTTTARIRPGDAITIGRPIANVRVHVLDKQLQPVPVRVPGELHVGGISVGRGYLNRGELTEERFIPDPFSDVPGARLYKTGDLVRYLPDGRLDFLGRLDFQVKVRGYRIELQEIENALEQHPAVGRVAVIAREASGGDKRLLAYVTCRQGQTADGSTLKAFLRERLPDYMTPAVFVFLEALPLMANGKVDSKRLPEPENLRPSMESSYVEPQTDMEKRIAAVWRELLQLDRVGIDDNFFELGGHSLMAVQIQNKLGVTLQRDVSVVEVFQCPTIRVLARHLETATEKAGEDAGKTELQVAALDEGRRRLSTLLTRSKGV